MTILAQTPVRERLQRVRISNFNQISRTGHEFANE